MHSHRPIAWQTLNAIDETPGRTTAVVSICTFLSLLFCCFTSIAEFMAYVRSVLILFLPVKALWQGLFRLVQRPEHFVHYLLPDNINSCSMEWRHKCNNFRFLGANITCIKTHLVHSVCSNMCSYWWFDGLMVCVVMVSLFMLFL